MGAAALAGLVGARFGQSESLGDVDAQRAVLEVLAVLA